MDDEIEEIRPLVEALHQIGAPCIGIHYDPSRGLEPRHFSGVRVLFFDLHLVKGQGLTAHARYAQIAQILESCINPVGGPYIIVLWTSHAEERDGFATYVETAVPGHQRPLAVLSLDKNIYVSGVGGTGAQRLRADVEQMIATNPQLQALLSWEADVLAAAGATLAALGELVPDDSRNAAQYPHELDGVLSRLATAAVGAPNVAKDPRSAVNAALAPILLDRILNQRASSAVGALWSKAVTRHDSLPDMGERQAGRMNRMLHVALPAGEELRPTDWGSVVRLPESDLRDDVMMARFGVKASEIFSQVFQVERPDRPRCTLCVVRIGAGCDYAQNRSGPIPYVLGLIMPATVVRRAVARPLSELESPIIELASNEDPVRLLVNARFQISLVLKDVAAWVAMFRIREQLLMLVASHVSVYVTRPGIVKLPQ